MLTRRQLLQRGAVGGAGLMLPGALLQSTAFGAANKTLKPYLTDLAAVRAADRAGGQRRHLDLAVRQAQRVVHSTMAAMPTTVWNYELAAAIRASTVRRGRGSARSWRSTRARR